MDRHRPPKLTNADFLDQDCPPPKPTLCLNLPFTLPAIPAPPQTLTRLSWAPSSNPIVLWVMQNEPHVVQRAMHHVWHAAGLRQPTSRAWRLLAVPASRLIYICELAVRNA